MHITPELIKQAKQAGSVEELLALAKEKGVELTAEEAQLLYDRWNTSAKLPDEALENAAGGGVYDLWMPKDLTERERKELVFQRLLEQEGRQ